MKTRFHKKKCAEIGVESQERVKTYFQSALAFVNQHHARKGSENSAA